MVKMIVGCHLHRCPQCHARPDKCRVEDIKGSLLQFFYALTFFSLVRMRMQRIITFRYVDIDYNEDYNEDYDKDYNETRNEEHNKDYDKDNNKDHN